VLKKTGTKQTICAGTCFPGWLFQTSMTMIVVTHEMGFAREVAAENLFMVQGRIIEKGDPDRFFNHPENERIRLF
jgi:ABC-type polar amino acid transport system ATPase subunit